MANPWFRMYSEFSHDPKVQSMSEAMQRRLIMLFCLRCSNGDVTLHETFGDDEMAFHWRISDDELAQTKALFVKKGFCDEQWNVVNWDKRQFTSDSSAERVARHREKKKQEKNSGCNGDVTLQKRQCNVVDTDTDTDTEVNTTVVESSQSLKGGDSEKPPTTRRGQVCRLLREAGMADAAPSYLTDETWEEILSQRTDEEIVDLAVAKMQSRPGQRTGLKYIAPALCEPPQAYSASPSNPRASPPMSQYEKRRLGAGIAIFGDVEGKRNERIINAESGTGELIAGPVGG